jgi:hypothetical protein
MDIHLHGTTAEVTDALYKLLLNKYPRPMDIHLHDTTAVNKYPRPMDIHLHDTTAELTDALQKLHFHK